MKVIRAEALGLCFGVRDAIDMARDVSRPRDVTIYGELVHNEAVLVELRARGFATVAERDRRDMPRTAGVLVTAHGISDRERARLEAAGKSLVDTTCPLVRRAHDAAKALADSGHHVLVIGRADHVEVRGIVEDLPSFDVVGRVEDVRTWPHPRLGIVCQTTTPPDLADEIRRAIRARNPRAEVRSIDTICQPTRDRQFAVARLCRQVDAVVVVGGRNSNNTRQLVELCRRHGTPAWQVQGPAEVDPAWFRGCRTLGLTAGTSTLDETIAAVEERLAEIKTSDALPG